MLAKLEIKIIIISFIFIFEELNIRENGIDMLCLIFSNLLIIYFYHKLILIKYIKLNGYFKLYKNCRRPACPKII